MAINLEESEKSEIEFAFLERLRISLMESINDPIINGVSLYHWKENHERKVLVIEINGTYYKTYHWWVFQFVHSRLRVSMFGEKRNPFFSDLPEVFIMCC